MLMNDDTGQAPKHRSLSAERVWHGVVGMCLVAAMFCLWNDQLDAAFVIATLGAVAWFMPLRTRLRRSTTEASAIAPRAKNENSFEVGDED